MAFIHLYLSACTLEGARAARIRPPGGFARAVLSLATAQGRERDPIRRRLNDTHKSAAAATTFRAQIFS
jgi:hypothetical protein